MAANLGKVSDFLTPEQVQALRGKSDIAGGLLVLHAWTLILGSMALFAWWPNPFTFLLGIAVIGGRQLGLAILMHDAAHGLLFADRRLNEWAGAWLCAFPVFTSLSLYRPYHLTHHRHTQQPNDPDLGLSAPFPISRASLGRKILRDLAGRTAYQRRGEQLRRGLGPAGRPLSEQLGCLWGREKGPIAVNIVLWAGLTLAGYWWLYPVMWLLPLATWYQLVSRIRNIAEHAMVPDNDDPLRNTRTTRANFFERLFISPYWVNYHLEHHLFMFVPCWRLPSAHRAMLSAGWGDKMELQPGYRAVLRLAASKTDDSGRGGTRRAAGQHI